MDAPDYSGWRAEPLPEPWMTAPDAMRPGLQAELAREVGQGHPLHGEHCTAVAKCGGCDEVVFGVQGPKFVRWARVHLTWSRASESLPIPATEFFGTLRAAVESHTH